MSRFFSIVCAVGPKGEFGCAGGMPWPRLKEDFELFKRATSDTGETQTSTKKNLLVMGRKTWESLGGPLPGRFHLVISRTNIPLGVGGPDGCASNLQNALDLAVQWKEISKIFVIGGASLIESALVHPNLEELYLTKVKSEDEMKADVSLNLVLPPNLKLQSQSPDIVCQSAPTHSIQFEHYIMNRPDHPEYEYLSLLSRLRIIHQTVSNRTGVPTVRSWGESLRFSLRGQFPLLTTKRVFWRGAVVELLFFLGGQTQTKVLEDQGVKIWSDNTSRTFLDKRGLDRYRVGEMGPMYPHLWRHFGAEHGSNEQLELGQGGVDQIKQVIENIRLVKADPSHEAARRLLVVAWNPKDLKKMAIAPCHYAFQFQVDGDELNALVNMRSSDVFLGLPFNIASYALLTYMIAHLTGLKPGTLVFSLADTHIYTNHLEQVATQLSRPPRPWPQLKLIGADNFTSIDEFHAENIKLVNYQPHPTLKGDMAI